MKRISLVLMFLAASIVTFAQQKQDLSTASSSCTSTSCLSVTVDQTQGGASFTITANASGNTIQFEASGDGGTTFVALNVAPTSGGSSVTSTTSTGTWIANTAGLTNIRVRMSALVGGTTTVSIIQSTASARAGGAGGSGGGAVNCTTTGGVAFENGTNNTLTCTADLTWVPGPGNPAGLSATNTVANTGTGPVLGVGGLADWTINSPNTAVGDQIGGVGTANAHGSGHFGHVIGLTGSANYDGTGTIDELSGNSVEPNANSGGGTVTLSNGYDCGDQHGVSGVLNACYYAPNQGTGANDYALYLNGGNVRLNPNLTYSGGTGVLQTANPGFSFAAPSVTPAVGGASTWGYMIVARQGTVNAARSAEGTTSTGTATLSGVDNNVVTWLAVPGATAYDVFRSTVASGSFGYLATVNAPTVTYTDTGTAVGASLVNIPESGFQETTTGIHGGNMNWQQVWSTPAFVQNAQFPMDAPVSVLQQETAAPSTVGSLTATNDFTAGNFWAWGHQTGGTSRAPVGLNALAIGDSVPGPVNGINGIVATAINNTGSNSAQNWEIGVTAAAVNNSIGSSNFLAALYGSTTQNATLTGSINTETDVFADVFSGTKGSANKIGVYSSFFASQGGASHANAGAAQLTAAYYTQDTGTGATDYSFYSVGGKNYFQSLNNGTSVNDTVQLFNTTAAAAGAQQYSPALHYQGQGWKTNATAASQAVDFRSYVIPIQGTANPTAEWVLESQVNGGGYGNQMLYTTAGQLILPLGTVTVPSLLFNTGGNATGIWSGAAGNVNIVSGLTDLADFQSSQVRITTAVPLGWTSGAPSATGLDTAFSRGAAGLIDVGTGPAASTAGYLKSTAMTATTAADVTCGTGGTIANCTSATTITGLSFTLPLVSATWHMDCELIVGQATAATANQWLIQTATNGATNTTAGYMMNTAATAMAGGAVTDQASTTTAFQIAPNWTLGGTGTKMPVHIWATVTGASASGTVLNLQVINSNSSDLLTIYEGSACTVK